MDDSDDTERTAKDSVGEGGRSDSISTSVVIKRVHSLIPCLPKLQENADLNLPPPNWLRTRGPAVYFHDFQFSPERGEPSSVLLASHYPDSVDQMDVIADSKNVKKLLKMPYCSSHVSMAIHRIGKTLLIDELTAALVSGGRPSSTLEKLIEEGELPKLPARKKDPAVTRHRNMFSKLLYYSVQDSTSRAMLPPPDSASTHVGSQQDTQLPPASHSRSQVILEDEDEEDNSSDSFHEVPYLRLSSKLYRPLKSRGDSPVTDSMDPEIAEASDLDVASCVARGAFSQSTLEHKTVLSETDPLDRDHSPGACKSAQQQHEPQASGLALEENKTPAKVPAQDGSQEKEEKLKSLALLPVDDAVHMFTDHISSVGDTRPLSHGFTPDSATSDTEGKPAADLDQRSTTPPSEPPDTELERDICPESGDVEACADLEDPAATDEQSSGREEDLKQQESFPCLPPEPPPQPFHLNVQWNIEDIRMLLGSELPIFGRGGHPAISLRLRDMQKPITVLTGLDYWLDNLMCNVPELAMCFHLNGIVQRYEVIKTEDIPNLDENCQFPPQEVLEVAQNILAFLKANCTQEGHTYWLFRRKGEDVVKLYDLTSLSYYEEEDDEQQNPFARSVAILFYRVARNMLNSGGPLSGEDLAMVRLLLENCIKLLGEEDRSQVREKLNFQIVISAHYLLSELFLSKVSSGVSPDERGDGGDIGEECGEAACGSGVEEGDDPAVCEVDESSTTDVPSIGRNVISATNSTFASVSALRQGPQSFSPDLSHPLPPLVVGNTQDRARFALEYITKGLSKLDVLELKEAVSSPSPPWQTSSAGYLLQQAGSAYLLLAEAAMEMNRLGRSLRYTRYSILCSSSSQVLCPQGGNAGTLYRAWQQCGDVHCLSTKLSATFDSHLEDFQLENPEDTVIITMATAVHSPQPGEKRDLCLTLHTNIETSLLRSIDCYGFAQKLVPSPTTKQQKMAQERLGNAWNELGVYYMHVAASLDFSKEHREIEKLWKNSYSCLMEGLGKFQLTASAPNQALLYANLGSLMRSCAQAHRVGGEEEGQGPEFSPQEKLYYSKAAAFYIQGKQVLRRRPAHPPIWGNLVADLSGVYFAMGKVMQENAPLSRLTPQEVEREIVEVLMKALQQLEPELAYLDSGGQRYVTLSQRAGDCHYRLGSLYQKTAFASTSSLQKQKHSRTQAERHYNKALHFYLPQHHFRKVLRVMLEKALLYEQQAQGKQQLKNLQNALDCLLGCYKSLEHFPEQHSFGDGDSSGQLLPVLVHRLQTVLKQLVALCMKRSDSAPLLNKYKSLYALVLRLPQNQSSETMLRTLRESYSSINALWKQIHT